jgi:hypothetical protein
VKLKRQYQMRVWSDSDLTALRDQLSTFSPEWILSACDEVIGTEEFYHVSKLRKCCLDYQANERMEKMYSEPDPFPEDSISKAFPIQEGWGLNGKLLAAQLAYLDYQSANGVTNPVKVPFRSKAHDELKRRIDELEGLTPYQKGQKVSEICA